MSMSLVGEDVVLTLALIGVVFLNRESLRRRLTDLGNPIVNLHCRRFTWFGLAYVIAVMVCGVLHQMGTLIRWPAYIAFGLLALIGVIGWWQLRRRPAIATPS